MKARAFLLSFALLLIAMQAAAQEAGLERLDTRTRAAVQAIIDSAAAKGLPTRPLVHKALEGVTKQAGGDRIVQVVRALANRLDAASRHLGSDASEAELVAGASALYVGIEPRALADLRVLRPAASLAMPLVTLTFFVQRGIDRGASVRWVESLVRANAGTEDLQKLQQAIDDDLRAGAPPAVAGQTRVDALLQRRGGGRQ